jgi:hypothetical protein
MAAFKWISRITMIASAALGAWRLYTQWKTNREAEQPSGLST